MISHEGRNFFQHSSSKHNFPLYGKLCLTYQGSAFRLRLLAVAVTLLPGAPLCRNSRNGIIKRSKIARLGSERGADWLRAYVGGWASLRLLCQIRFS